MFTKERRKIREHPLSTHIMEETKQRTWNQFTQEIRSCVADLASDTHPIYEVHIPAKRKSLFQVAAPGCNLYIMTKETLERKLTAFHCLNTVWTSYRALDFSPAALASGSRTSLLPASLREGLSALADQVEDLLCDAASPEGLPKVNPEAEPIDHLPDPLFTALQELYPFGHYPMDAYRTLSRIELDAHDLFPEDTYPPDVRALTSAWVRLFCAFARTIFLGADTPEGQRRLERALGNICKQYRDTILH